MVSNRQPTDRNQYPSPIWDRPPWYPLDIDAYLERDGLHPEPPALLFVPEDPANRVTRAPRPGAEQAIYRATGAAVDLAAAESAWPTVPLTATQTPADPEVDRALVPDVEIEDWDKPINQTQIRDRLRRSEDTYREARNARDRKRRLRDWAKRVRAGERPRGPAPQG